MEVRNGGGSPQVGMGGLQPWLFVYIKYCWILDTFRMKQTQMYVCTLEKFILVEIWIHCCTKLKWIYWKIHWYLWEMLLSIELQLHEKLSTERTNVWIVIPLFGALITPGGVNGNLHWLLLIKQWGKLLNVIPGVSTFTWQDETWN